MSSSVSYDSTNRELRTVRKYFAAKDAAVLQIKWKEGIRKDARIKPGRILAHIIWDGLPAEPVRAPAGCEGTIESTNRRIRYEFLHRRVETLLRLKAT